MACSSIDAIKNEQLKKSYRDNIKSTMNAKKISPTDTKELPNPNNFVDTKDSRRDRYSPVCRNRPERRTNSRKLYCDERVRISFKYIDILIDS